MTDELKDRPESGPGYEKGEPRMGLVASAFGAMVIGLVLVILAIQAVYDRVQEEQIFVKVLEPVSEDLRNLRAREDGQLHSYQYIDRAAGSVRIPIERAMEMIEKEAAANRLGYPTKPAPVRVEPPPAAQGAGNAK